MLRITFGFLGGGAAGRRRVAAAATKAVSASASAASSRQQPRAKSLPRGRSSRTARRSVSTNSRATRDKPRRRTPSPPASSRTNTAMRGASPKKASPPTKPEKMNAEIAADAAREREEAQNASARPAYMSAEREEEVLAMAERMQRRDLTCEVPVASFAYEILKAHPSVRQMGLRERMDFLLTRWAKLSQTKRVEYINDPLRGLL